MVLHETIWFLISVVTISLSGVMAPGPMTTATLAAGTRNRHAGAVMAIGHGIVEFPLMVLIVLGVGRWFQVDWVKVTIGLLGGLFLILLGILMLRNPGPVRVSDSTTGRRGELLTGIFMTAGNPYFLIWWATVGLALTTQASAFVVAAFAIFAFVHWLCDLVWLEALSLASAKGSELLRGRSQRIVLIICACALVGFGIQFVWSAGKLWLKGA